MKKEKVILIGAGLWTLQHFSSKKGIEILILEAIQKVGLPQNDHSTTS
jgi:hypothetical protein